MQSSTNHQAFPGSIPENFEMAVLMTRAELDHHLRLMAALKMFELGQISSGKATEFVGMCRVDFFETCARYRVSIFNYPPGELEAEIRRELDAFSAASASRHLSRLSSTTPRDAESPPVSRFRFLASSACCLSPNSANASAL